MMMYLKVKHFVACMVMLVIAVTGLAQRATIREEMVSMKSYLFSDPDPVPTMSRIYPYFRFDGYTNKAVNKDWKMVVLENDYIKVYVCPAVGGKVWGAFEKSTGKEFLYYNNVVKFRDVAMRGAWTSGGLEYNFGDIGHIPTCATPVDYALKEYPDGSVACVVGAIDLPSRTKWNVEIKLGKDQAFFETTASWFNTNNIPVTYYHWMNAAAKADGDLEFLYPGNKRIGHGGELGDWPSDNNRDISRYKNNDFGIYKSYHVLGTYSDYFGGYWHDDDFGFGHYASYDDKPGKKIWIWGLSDQGMIWKDLLTDKSGQYIEFQAGKLFNQAANSSTFTPFKHREFMPNDADVMREIWFPLKQTKGMVAASEYGALNAKQHDDKLQLWFSALQTINDDLIVSVGQKEIFRRKVSLKPLELFEATVALSDNNDFTIIVGDNKLVYHSNKKETTTDRPVNELVDFNWESAYGHYVEGLELEKQRRYDEAQTAYGKSLKKEPSYAPALNRLALGYYRKNQLPQALDYARQSLAINTYDGLGNYMYGLINKELGNSAPAKSGFSIAAQSVTYRTASYTELGKMFLLEGMHEKALEYVRKALIYDAYNMSALEMQAVIYRKMNRETNAMEVLKTIYNADATSLFYHFENFKWGKAKAEMVQAQVTNELPYESYLELASNYLNYGCKEEALQMLNLSPEYAIVSLWKAFLDNEHQPELLKTALQSSASMVFPHRKETAAFLQFFISQSDHWKLKYYLALQNWSIGNLKEARELMVKCGDAPDIVPFYLAKIKLFPDDENLALACLKRATEIEKNNRRVQLAWIKYYQGKGDVDIASERARTLVKQYPEISSLGLLYARILLNKKEYKKCLEFLEQYKVLPFEGATEGRTIYHEVCIQLALKSYLAKDYTSAIKYAQKSKLWPKNLGVGKHYDVDERLDNYLMALAYEKKGNNKEAQKYYAEIMSHITPDYLDESSKLYLQLDVLKKMGKTTEAEKLVAGYKTGNDYVKWAILKVNKGDHESLKKAILGNDQGIQAYDIKFIDQEFMLVSEVVSQLEESAK